jgi:peptidylprolyl isomerase
MKNGVIFFLGAIAILAVLISVFSQLKTGQPLSRNKDTNRLNILGNSDRADDTPMPTPIKSDPPEMEIILTNKYTATFDTSKGPITVELFADKTPRTVNNFVALARKGFYDNTVFHRIIEGFMIQGGDPKGDGTGGPGYKFDDESFEGEYTRGTIAMANAGPDTNGSQFFIMHEDTLSLPKNYVIFGKVTEGLDTVDAIAESPVSTSMSGEKSKPVTPIKVKTITIDEEEVELTPTSEPTVTPEASPTETPTPTTTPTPNP